MNNKTLAKYYFLPILTYFSFSVVIYFVLYQFGFVDKLPNSQTLNSGDAGFYHSIMNNGYFYQADAAGNVGFFPLFAYWWRLTHLGWVGITVLNGLIYLFSLGWLCKMLKPDKMVLGLFMASPYMFFMWSALSEPIFFLFSVAIVYGILNKDWRFVFVGTLLASMTRATFLFFIPAYVGMALMSYPIDKILNWNTWKKIFSHYLLPCLLGVSAVVLFQYMQTGKWFAYFEVQTRVWGRAFDWPAFPFGYRTVFWNLKSSYVSFWIAMVTAGVGLKLLWDWFRKKEILKSVKDYELFSIIFICMSLVSIVFFNAHWMWNPDGEGGGFMSTHFTGINRYTHPTVFFLILLGYYFNFKKLSLSQYFGIFFISNLIWFCFDLEYYSHIQRYLKFLIPNLIIISLLLYHATRWKILGYGIILGSFILQGLLYNHYLSLVQLD